jgi:hypothetical protein
MSGFDVATIIILVLLCVIVLGVIYFLASWPGRIAVERGHPYASAVQIGGWATLLFGGIFWPLVLMWAFVSGEDGRPSRAGEQEPGGRVSAAEKMAEE